MRGSPQAITRPASSWRRSPGECWRAGSERVSGRRRSSRSAWRDFCGLPRTTVLLQPSASYSFILRTETSNKPGNLGRVTTAIGDEGGDIGAIDIVRTGGGSMVRDLTIAARDEAHAQTIVD